MVARDEDAADVRFPPPVVYLASAVAGVLLHAFAVPFPLSLPPAVRILAASLSFGAAVVVMAAAVRSFQRIDQDPKPWKTTPEVIATGVYRFTRNPMYLSLALAQAALAFGLANAWILLLVPVSLAVVWLIAVRPEEAYLEAKFGEAYLAYKRAVRRWI